MKKAILAKKIGMTQIFTAGNKLVGVTVLQAGPCVVVQKKTDEKEGYNAIQVGFESIVARKVTKPLKGHFNKVGPDLYKYLREFRLEKTDAYQVGGEINADIFKEGERVDVSGISKGKGYQGPIKRHHQSRGPMAHGSKYHRGPGSLSSATTPGRVKKGKPMAGHMGMKRRTAQNLEVVKVYADKNVILIKGPVPGARGALVIVKDTVKA